MFRTDLKTRVTTCQCGEAALEAQGDPVVTTICHCSSCEEAGRRLEALPGAAPILDRDGGTPFILFRKDRVRCLRGESLLSEHRLKPTSPTRRIVATCCNTAMFLDFTKGHWVTFYKGRVPEDEQPPVEMRVMTKDRDAGTQLTGNIPGYRKHSGPIVNGGAKMCQMGA